MQLARVESESVAAERTSVCHVCGSPKVVPFMTATDNGHLRDANIKLPVYQCRACDVFFLNPPPPAELGREYFATAYAKNTEGNVYYDDGFKQRISMLRLDLIAGRGAASGRLLDVGCGKGQFVQAARTRGFDAWGVELDAGACAYARNHFTLATVLNGSLDHPDLPREFDVVTLWDVIEHVPDPVGILKQSLGRLRPGGLIVVRTGNIRSWSFDRGRERWWAFGADHRFYFSPESLSAALRLAGFEVDAVVNCETTERPDKRKSRDISDTSVAEGLLSVTKSPKKLAKTGTYATNLVRRTWGGLRYGAHYQTSIMTVIARRPAAARG